METPPSELRRPPAPRLRRPPAARSGWKGYLWLLFFAVLGYGAYRYFQAGEQKRQAAEAQQAQRLAHRPVSVAAVQARRGDVPIILRGLGTVTAFNTVNVKTRVDGPIVAVNYKEGQFVHQGETLVEIDPRPFQVALEQAQGALARDQAQLKDAQVNLERDRALWEAQVIARQQYDTQGATVGQYQGAITADQAAIDNAKLNLSFTKVTAPISGRIGLRLVDAGNIAHASDANPLVVITQMQPISVLFTIPADNLPPVLAKLRAGQKLPVDASDRADRNKIASGSLLTVDNQIDPNTGTSRLKAVFNNDDNALFPNQFVNCRLLLDTHRGVTLIPVAAVQRGPQGDYVYVVDGSQTAHMRQITLGISEGGDQEVTSGLAPGDVVVTDGQDKLQEGGKAQITSGAVPPGRIQGAPGSSVAPSTPRKRR